MRIGHNRGGEMKKRVWLVVVIAAWAATGAGALGTNVNRTATEGWATARIRDLRLGLEAQIGARPTYEDAESIAAAAAAGINPGRAARLVHVDGAATNTAQTGSAAAPYLTVQAAFDHIGDAENAEAYADVGQRYWQVNVAPGRYVGNVMVPWRPYVGINLDSAVIAGDVIRVVPAWTGTISNRTSTLVIRGNSMRAAYLDGIHSVVGVEGAVRFQGSAAVGLYASLIHELHVNQAGISNGVRFEGGSNNQMGHVFLRDAQAGALVSTNGWHGVSLFAYGWSGGHTGGGPAGSGIGPLIGTVVPYNIYDMLISKGMTLTAPYSGWAGACRWHNVVFEAGDYTVTNIGYRVNLDMASYTSWLAATTNVAGRGAWRLGQGERMALTDAPEPQVTGTNAPTRVLPRWTGDELVVTGAVKKVYKAFGGGTNDWLPLGP